MIKTDSKFEIECLEAIDGTNIFNDNIDVIVRIDGSNYVATFFTLSNVESLMKRYETTGECLKGTYFWCSSMVVVRDLSPKTIEATVRDLISSGEFSSLFEGPEAP